MAKKGRPKKPKLFNTEPDNIEEILVVAEEYEEAKRARMSWGKKESELKEKIKQMVKDAGLTVLADGTIRFKADGKVITITPRDEKITVTEAKDE